MCVYLRSVYCLGCWPAVTCPSCSRCPQTRHPPPDHQPPLAEHSGTVGGRAAPSYLRDTPLNTQSLQGDLSRWPAEVQVSSPVPSIPYSSTTSPERVKQTPPNHSAVKNMNWRKFRWQHLLSEVAGVASHHEGVPHLQETNEVQCPSNSGAPPNEQTTADTQLITLLFTVPGHILHQRIVWSRSLTITTGILITVKPGFALFLYFTFSCRHSKSSSSI